MAAAAAAWVGAPSASVRAKAEVRPRQRRFGGDIRKVLRRDGAFLREKVGKRMEDFFWLRHLEAVDSSSSQSAPPWPRPSYPGFSGMDLLMADLEALKLYSNCLLHIPKLWSMPLPEVYDAEKVAIYFNCRPHVVVSRLVEVFSSFAIAALKLHTSKKLRFDQYGKKDDITDDSQYFLGQLLKETMLGLGSTFIKVGQSLSTRPDLIGSEICHALSELHNNIPPFSRTLAMKIIEEELGCPIEGHFSYVSEKAVGAASFGQVYRGCTCDGHAVAIKVQRPNIRHSVARDIYILRLGLGLFRKVAKRKSDIRLYADEIGKGFVGELDYTLEALNATEFLRSYSNASMQLPWVFATTLSTSIQEAHNEYPFIYVPKVFKHLSSKKVLTMEWVVGENPTDLLLLSNGFTNDDSYKGKLQSEARKCLLDLVNKGVKASLIQLLETGLLHADPHPGNLFYTQERQIGFVDFGLLCRMQKKHQIAMLSSIVHIANGDWASLVLDLLAMDVVPPGTNIRRVTMAMEHALGEVELVNGIPDIKFSKVLGKIWSVAYKFHFRMPPYYTLVLRSLASLEGLAVAADPGFKTFRAACPYVVQKLLHDNSPSIRKILYSVVFNNKKELQWKKIALFVEIGLSRKQSTGLKSDSDKYPDLTGNAEGVVGTAMILRLLSSNDGVVMRRLFMDADSRSLVHAVISNEATFFRQHFIRLLSDVIYNFLTKVLRSRWNLHNEWHTVNAEQGSESRHPFSGSSSLLAFSSVIRDRRVKLITFKTVSSVRNDPILLLRLCWTSFMVVMSATASALHRFVISFWQVFITPFLPTTPRRFALGL